MKKLITFILLALVGLDALLAQNVGIGTSSPGTKLDINGALTTRDTTIVISGGVSIPTGNWSVIKVTGTLSAAATITGPTPTNSGMYLTLYNATTGGYSISMNSIAVPNGKVQTYIYEGGAWQAVSAGSASSTTNSLSSSGNVLTSTVNGSVATANAVNSVSNTSSGNNLSTTVNGITGSNVQMINSVSNTSSTNTLTTTVNGVSSAGANIINSNALTWTQGAGLTNTVNGVSATVTPASGTVSNVLGYSAGGAPVYQSANGMSHTVSNTVSGNTISTTVDATTGTAVTVPNIYTANGTLTASRTVTQAANNLTFSSTTGNLIFNPSSTGKVGIGDASPLQSLSISNSTGLYSGNEFDAHGLSVKTGVTSSDYLLYMGADKTNGNSYIQSVRYGVAIAPLLLNARGGNVGIGTSAPDALLGVQPATNYEAMLGGGTNTGSELKLAATGNSHFSIYNKGTNTLTFALTSTNISTNIAGSALMTLSSAGYLGLGTTSPTFPLDVQSTISSTVSNYGYLNSSGTAAFFSGTQTPAISIRSTGRILASEFNAISDKRVKTNIQAQASDSMLAEANKLRVVHYNYIDKLTKGSKTKTGFIAQEVKEVMPDAVNLSSDVIPNVFAASEHVSLHDSLLTVTTCDTNGFAPGDEIVLYDKNNKRYDVMVASVQNSRTFTVAHWADQTGELFVYGKKVNDFHSIDFDQITAMTVGALQELNRELVDLRDENTGLKKEIERLKREQTNMNTQFDQLKAEVSAINEKMGLKACK
jgi:hypothetical protein